MLVTDLTATMSLGSCVTVPLPSQKLTADPPGTVKHACTLIGVQTHGICQVFEDSNHTGEHKAFWQQRQPLALCLLQQADYFAGPLSIQSYHDEMQADPLKP